MFLLAKVHLGTLSSRSDHLVEDYLALVRTRIKDLSGSPFESSAGTAIDLVQQALLEFEQTGHIISQVIEASIFRAPFYVGSFLPSLLSASQDDMVRRNLIRELNR